MTQTPLPFLKSVTDWIVQSGIQLSSTWQFDQNNLKATDKGIDGEKLENFTRRRTRSLPEQGKIGFGNVLVE